MKENLQHHPEEERPRDFLDHWAEKLAPYYNEEWLNGELDRYRELGKNWHEDNDDFEKTMNTALGNNLIQRQLDERFPPNE